MNEGAEAILDDAFGYYKHKLRRNFEKGLHALMRVDQFTKRDYIRQVMYAAPPFHAHAYTDRGYDFFSVQYLETTSRSAPQHI